MNTVTGSYEPNPDEDRDWLDWLQTHMPVGADAGDTGGHHLVVLKVLEPALAAQVATTGVRGRG